MKLWLDDLREPPDSSWHWFKTISECKAYLRAGLVDVASFDHDLGSPACTGSACWDDQGLKCKPKCPCSCHVSYPDGSELLRWMAEHNVWPSKELRFHTGNPLGRRYMEGILRRYGPDCLKPKTELT